MDFFKRVGTYFFYSVFAIFAACIFYFEIDQRFRVPAYSKLILCFAGILFLLFGSALRVSSLSESAEKVKTLKTTIWIMFLMYIVYLMFLLFFDREYSRGLFTLSNPSVDFATYFKMKTNFIPFKTITSYIKGWLLGNVYTRSIIMNIVGNLIAFSPFGIFCPLLFKKLKSFKNFSVFIVLVLAAVEIAQLYFMAGSCDVDDVILNFIGACALFYVMQIKLLKGYFTHVGIEY